MPDDELLKPAEAAEILRVPVGTLKWWRYKGLGPPYMAFASSNIVRYSRLDLEGWLADNTYVPVRHRGRRVKAKVG